MSENCVNMRPFAKLTCSERGPHSSGPKQKPITNRVIVNATSSAVILNWRSRSAAQPDGAAEAKVLDAQNSVRTP